MHVFVPGCVLDRSFSLDELLRRRMWCALKLNTEGVITPAYVVNTNMILGIG